MRILDDRPGSASRNWMVSGVIWFALGVTFGLIGAIEMAVPDFLAGSRYFHFGRIRPMHVNIVAYGFLSMVLVGAGLWYVPQLCRTKLYSERLANLAMWLWNFVQLAGIITIGLGYTSTHEYAEYIAHLDVLTIVALALLSYVGYRTVASRKEKLIYVSIWYFLAACLWTLTQWIFLGGTGVRSGLYDAVWTWFYGHNIFGLWETPASIAAAYYVIPREARRPIYSHTLSLIGFWLLVVDYAPTGTHHLLQAPVPAWQKVVASVHSVVLIFPVYVFLTNVWLTLRGRMGRIEQSITLKYVFAGTIFYFIVSTQGSLQSLMVVQRLTHFTQWVVAHAHIGLLGFSAFIAVGVMYDVLPQIVGRPIHSARLANVQYWFMLLGLTGFMVFLTAAGLIQGSSWINGEEVYRVLPQIHLYFVLRAWIGILVVAAAYIMLYNVLMTIRGAPLDREPGEPSMHLRDVETAET